jgi:hypothetical protein
MFSGPVLTVNRYLPLWLVSTQHGAVCPQAYGLPRNIAVLHRPLLRVVAEARRGVRSGPASARELVA